MSNGDQSNCPTPVDTTIKVTTAAIGPPAHPTPVPWDFLSDYFHEAENVFEQAWGVPSWWAIGLAVLACIPGVILVLVSHVVLWVIRPFVTAVGAPIFEVLDDIRKTLDPQFAGLAVEVLNELLGTDFNVTHLPQGPDIGAHLARAEEIGYLFHRQMLAEFLAATGVNLQPGGPQYTEPAAATGAGEKITPISGVRAAARFTGLAINFGTASGILGVLGELVPILHIDQLREIGEEVARNLGLGRLQRLALAPIVQILLAEPYKWFINELARPTQLGLGEVVNPFSGAVMKPELIWRDLARAGYSDDKIQAVLELHRKKLNEADLLTLLEGGHFDQPTVTTQLERLGYEHDQAILKTEADHLRAQRPFQDELRSAVTTAYADGHTLQGEMLSIIDSMPLTDDEKALAKLVANYKKKVPSKHLTLAELQTALEKGIIDLAEFTDHLTNLGYSDDDQSILLLLTLDKLDAQKQKAAAAAARAAAKASKGASSPLPPATPPSSSTG